MKYIKTYENDKFWLDDPNEKRLVYKYRSYLEKKYNKKHGINAVN